MEQISEQLKKQIEEEEQLDWVVEFEKVHRKYTDEVVQKMVLEEMNRTIAFIKDRRAKVYSDNDERRRKGMPFAEREKLLDRGRLKFCDEYEARLTRDVQVFKVKPLHQWFAVDDYWDARRKGMAYVIRFNLDRIYYVPQQH